MHLSICFRKEFEKELKFSELELFFVYLLKIWPSYTQGAFIDQKKLKNVFYKSFSANAHLKHTKRICHLIHNCKS